MKGTTRSGCRSLTSEGERWLARTQIVNGGVDVAQKPIWIEGPHLFARDGFTI
jgi:hypothetical protein